MHPRDAPYTLEVNQREEELPNGETITRRWAALHYHNPDKPTYDDNPTVEQYIQQRPVTVGEDEPQRDSIAADSLQSTQEEQIKTGSIGTQEGWENNRDVLTDFLQTVRDNHYLGGIAQNQLPVQLLIYTDKDRYSSDEDPFEGDYFEVYFRDSPSEDIEYVMWSAQEMYGVHGEAPVAHNELIQKVIVAFANAYEEPSNFISTWSHHKVQVEDKVVI
jgi:hypothetical protein